MKRIYLVAILALGMAQTAFGRDGYHIYLKMPGVKDSIVYLTHYYGKPLPTIYKSDSARFKNGIAEFRSNDSTFVGGIYMMLLGNRKTYFEFLLDKGDDISITADINKLPEGLTFKNSPENNHFQQYESFLSGYSKKQKELHAQLAGAKTAEDSTILKKTLATASKELIAYRHNYIKEYPNTLLAEIFRSLDIPEVPEGPHYLADGVTKDSAFAYNFYKNHFWDEFNFQDDRLIYTPVYDARLNEYINKLVLPWPDSIEKEADMLLSKARGTKDMFKYTLWWLTRNVEDSKIMGMDEVFVYLVENYYMKGDAFWLSNNDLNKYIDMASKIAPNVIGNISPEVKLPDVFSKQPESMLGLKAKYTLLVFYSPSCGHCQHELPELDSLYRAELKDMGVKVFTVATEGDEKSITDFVKKNKLEEWTNTWDHDRVGDWRSKFDVYSTPTIYLLDEKKIIKGKRLDHSNLASLVEMLNKESIKPTKTKS